MSNLTIAQNGPANITIRGCSTLLVLRSGTIVPVATANTAGTVIVGGNLTVDANGVLSANIPTASGVTAFNNRTGNVSLQLADVQPLTDPLYMNVVKNTDSYYGLITETGSTNYYAGFLTRGNTSTATQTTFLGSRYVNSTANNPTALSLLYQSNTTASNTVSCGTVTVSGTSVGISSSVSVNGTQSTAGGFTASSSTTSLFFTNGTGSYPPSFSQVFAWKTGVVVYSAQATNASQMVVGGRWDLANGVYNAANSVTVSFYNAQTASSITPDWFDDSLITRSYADTRYMALANMSLYLTTANAATTYQPIGTYLTPACLTYANLTGTPPIANATQLGSVKVGANLTIDANGVLSANASGGGVSLSANNTWTGVQSFNGTVSLNSNMAAGGNLLTQPKLQAYRETSTTPAISSGTLTLDLSGSNFFAVSLNAAITTFTISNTPSSAASSFTLEFTADGTARAVAWPSSVKWASGTTPTLTSTSGKKDVFAFYSTDGGTSWIGFVGGQNF